MERIRVLTRDEVKAELRAFGLKPTGSLPPELARRLTNNSQPLSTGCGPLIAGLVKKYLASFIRPQAAMKLDPVGLAVMCLLVVGVLVGLRPNSNAGYSVEPIAVPDLMVKRERTVLRGSDPMFKRDQAIVDSKFLFEGGGYGTGVKTKGRDGVGPIHEEDMVDTDPARVNLAYRSLFPLLPDEAIVFLPKDESAPLANSLGTNKEIGDAYNGSGNRNNVQVFGFRILSHQLATTGSEFTRDEIGSATPWCSEGAINYGNCVGGALVRNRVQQMSLAGAAPQFPKVFPLTGRYAGVLETPKLEKHLDELQQSSQSGVDRGLRLPLAEYVKFENVPADKCATCPRPKELRVVAEFFNVFNSQNARPEGNYTINRVSTGVGPGEFQVSVKFKF